MGRRVPCVGISGLGRQDRHRVRRALRKAGFSCNEIEGWLVVLTGEAAQVSDIAHRYSAKEPRVRADMIDGKEFMQAQDEPLQFKIRHDETGELVFREQSTK